MAETEDGIEVDDNMVRLIDVLNSIPAVDTFSSCGGHDDPKSSQVAAGRFTVSLSIEQNRHGWVALGLLARAIIPMDSVTLHPWDNSDPEEDEEPMLDWALSGSVSPDALAEIIENLLN
jgi:hypothetical protein